MVSQVINAKVSRFIGQIPSSIDRFRPVTLSPISSATRQVRLGGDGFRPLTSDAVRIGGDSFRPNTSDVVRIGGDSSTL